MKPTREEINPRIKFIIQSHYDTSPTTLLQVKLAVQEMLYTTFNLNVNDISVFEQGGNITVRLPDEIFADNSDIG